MNDSHARKSMQDQLAEIQARITNPANSQPKPEISMSAREDFSDDTEDSGLGSLDTDWDNPMNLEVVDSTGRRVQARQYGGRVKSAPSELKTQIGGTSMRVAMTDTESREAIHNMLELQRAEIKRSKAGTWSTVAASLLGLIGTLGLGFAAYKGVTSKTTNEV
jgi:hypothetical protein